MAFVAASLAAQQPDQEEIFRLANQVRKKVITLGNYGVFDDITFGISKGNAGYVITLKGFASRPTLQKSAERAATGIETVESTVNEIEGLPTSRRDDDIRLETFAKVYRHPALSRYNPNRDTPVYGLRSRAAFGISKDPPIGPHPIHIIVKNGNVTLVRVVDTEGDKSIAELQANSVSGAFSVTNNLKVSGKE